MSKLDEAEGPRDGYELWRPNRQKAESKTTKAIVALVLLISAALLVIITLGGFERLQSPGTGFATIAWAGLYVVFAFFVMGWQRGLLPVAAVMAIVMAIFAGVAAPGWFARDKPGLDSPLIPEDLLGLLTLILIPVQLLLVVVSMVAFNQEWHVEEERKIEDHPAHDDDGFDGGEPVYSEADEDYGDSYEDEGHSSESQGSSSGSSSQGWSPPSASTT